MLGLLKKPNICINAPTLSSSCSLCLRAYGLLKLTGAQNPEPALHTLHVQEPVPSRRAATAGSGPPPGIPGKHESFKFQTNTEFFRNSKSLNPEPCCKLPVRLRGVVKVGSLELTVQGLGLGMYLRYRILDAGAVEVANSN